MKKVLLTSLMAVFAVSAANATDYFVGGSAAFTFDKADKTGIVVAPEFGYKYNNVWDFGVDAKFGYANEEFTGQTGTDSYEYGAGVFARYKVAEFGHAKLLLKGRVGADFETLSTDDATHTWASLNASIVPMVTYDISESFTLYANLNFLGVNAGYTFENEDMGTKSDWNISGIFDSADVANTSAFQIGFFYNF